MRELLEVFLLFMKIGSVTFGGGYAMLPILERELVDKRGWVTEQELTDYFAIGQCTPGIIAVNVSTFTGYKRKGVLGGIVATLGFVTIPIIIIVTIAALLKNFATLKLIQHAFAGIRVCVCVLILQAVQRLWKSSVVSRWTLVIFILVLILTACSKLLPISVSPAVLVIGTALLGVVRTLKTAKGGESK